MDGATSGSARDAIDIIVEADGWHGSIAEIDTIAREAALLVLADQRETRPLNILLTSDASIQKLNAEFRGQDKPTNVLSFPSSNQFTPELGDIALALETVLREASEQNKSVLSHTQHLIVHGVLHLLGFDHENNKDADIMERVEIRLLEKLGVPDPYRREAGD